MKKRIRKWFSWLMVGVVVASVAVWLLRPGRLPDRVRIATAVDTGAYHAMGLALEGPLRQRLRRPVEVKPTAGSVENAGLLRPGGEVAGFVCAADADQVAGAARMRRSGSS